MTDRLAHEISTTLGDHADDYDIDAIARELIDRHGPIRRIDEVPTDLYWRIVSKHDTARNSHWGLEAARPRLWHHLPPSTPHCHKEN
jgi:hypothetical protein